MDTMHWTLPTDHPVFAGHFPGHPIIPGALLLDQAIQLAAQHMALPRSSIKISNAKFLHPAGPGQTLTFTFDRKESGALQFTVRCGEIVVASGVLTLLLP